MIVCVLLTSFPLSLLAQIPVSQIPKENSVADTDTVHAESLKVNVDTTTVSESEEIQKGFGKGYNDGIIAGAKQDQSSWLIAGAGGMALFCLGSGIVWHLAISSGEHPKYIPNGDTEYTDGYITGYHAATRASKASSACIGSVVGMLAVVVGVQIVYMVQGK